MALEKITKIDKIEIIGDGRILQIREATVILEDGVELTRKYHRRILNPMTPTISPEDTATYIDTDISEETTEIQNICSTIWTTNVKTDFKSKINKVKTKDKK